MAFKFYKLAPNTFFQFESARNEFKFSEFMCKTVARMLTVKQERELDEGMRISKKLDRQWRKSTVIRPPPSLFRLQEEKAVEEAKKSSAS
ncbi:hypothetical protein LguiB_008299 [Lonicera macranthoides]